jgi:hypothetical protein
MEKEDEDEVLMSEKKVVSRNIAIILGIVCIIFLVGLVGAIANYTSIISGKDNIIASKDSQIQTLTNQKNQLQTWLDENKTLLQQQIQQITDLQNQITALNAPKLIKVNLRADDNRPWLGTPYLHVYGYVCNVGTYPAYNSKIHVVAYQSGGVIAIDTYSTLGTTMGESWTSVDSNIYYSGSALTGWSLTLEWTT